MNPEQLVALVGAVAALLTAVAVVLQRIGELRREINGRLTQLLEEATAAAEKRGELAGRDFIHRLYAPPIDAAAHENRRSVDVDEFQA